MSRRDQGWGHLDWPYGNASGGIFLARFWRHFVLLIPICIYYEVAT
jgi:hypothetical protein